MSKGTLNFISVGATILLSVVGGFISLVLTAGALLGLAELNDYTGDPQHWLHAWAVVAFALQIYVTTSDDGPEDQERVTGSIVGHRLDRVTAWFIGAGATYALFLIAYYGLTLYSLWFAWAPLLLLACISWKLSKEVTTPKSTTKRVKAASQGR